MSESARAIHERVLDDMRRRKAAAPRSSEWAALESELEAHGLDTTDFGLFSSMAPTTFDYESAAPILVERLARARDPMLKETIARSLTGVRIERSAAAGALVAAFRNEPSDEELGLKWAYANALATLADTGIADDLLELIRDRRHGRAREMLCEALKRTNDPRAAAALILIDDDAVAGHAISALRSFGPKRSLPYLEQARPKLEALLARPEASEFARRQARAALERVASAATSM